jgi:hypothetical protein
MSAEKPEHWPFTSDSIMTDCYTKTISASRFYCCGRFEIAKAM